MANKLFAKIMGNRVVSLISQELLLPIVAVVVILSIAVALIEGPALDTFLYAVF